MDNVGYQVMYGDSLADKEIDICSCNTADTDKCKREIEIMETKLGKLMQVDGMQ